MQTMRGEKKRTIYRQILEDEFQELFHTLNSFFGLPVGEGFKVFLDLILAKTTI